MFRIFTLLVWLLVGSLVGAVSAQDFFAWQVPLPPRPENAPKGDAFARSLTLLSFAEREQAVLAEVQRGNVPGFWRKFAMVKITRISEGQAQTAVYLVSPDYLAIGADDDYYLAPVSPMTAQAIADALECVLPTRKMVDDIYAAAAVKLAPLPIPPGTAMTTVPLFQQHNEGVRLQRAEQMKEYPLGALVAGHKKDIVLTSQLAAAPGKVAIYGWHQLDGKAIQPLHLDHVATWVDYSHGARFVRRKVALNGELRNIEEVWSDEVFAKLLSDEGPLKNPRYVANVAPTNAATNSLPNGIKSQQTLVAPSDRTKATTPTRFAERTETFALEPGVRVQINSPSGGAWNTNKPMRLVLYALPNGSSIEQCAGRLTQSGGDWHFDSQHIAAQTRWLRERMHDANLVVAYLECADKDWPTWRRKNDADNTRIPALVEKLRQRFAGQPLKLVLTGHSGGGSFTFGFLNGVTDIPADVERIALLDSNYGYDAALHHDEKIVRWLQNGEAHYLCVLAYHDSAARLEGKPFVSETGGTWGRSHAMIKDLAKQFTFVRGTNAEFQLATTLGGRVKFFLKENPTKAILHTRQVELNGFLHALVTGTEREGQDYTYFGPRAYEAWIAK